MIVEKMLLTPNKYSRPETKIGKIKNIVIHWVGNANSTARGNRNYFEGLKEGKTGGNGKYVYASSHYIIGLDGEIIQCVPEEEVAYHASSANSYSIGIECCHPDWEGKFNQKTIDSIVGLCSTICEKYGLNPLSDIIRHFDVTNKNCPQYYIKNEKAWTELKNQIADSNKNKVDTELVEAVGILSKAGVINTTDAWNDVSKFKPQYYDGIISNYLRVIKKKVGCNSDCRIVLLYREGIITELVSWLTEVSPQMMRSLIVKMSKNLK